MHRDKEHVLRDISKSENENESYPRLFIIHAWVGSSQMHIECSVGPNSPKWRKQVPQPVSFRSYDHVVLLLLYRGILRT